MNNYQLFGDRIVCFRLIIHSSPSSPSPSSSPSPQSPSPPVPLSLTRILSRIEKRFGAMAMGLLGWLKGKGSQKSGLEPLTDEQYKALFYRLLEGVASGWDADRLRQVLGDRIADPQFLVWLRGYGEGLLTGTNGDWARLLVRLGEVGCGEIGVMAREFGLRALEMIPPAPLDKGGVLVDGLQDQDGNSLPQLQETYSSLENEQSDEAEEWFEKGNSLYSEGHYQEALTFYDQALKIKLDILQTFII